MEVVIQLLTLSNIFQEVCNFFLAEARKKANSLHVTQENEEKIIFLIKCKIFKSFTPPNQLIYRETWPRSNVVWKVTSTWMLLLSLLIRFFSSSFSFSISLFSLDILANAFSFFWSSWFNSSLSSDKDVSLVLLILRLSVSFVIWLFNSSICV